MSIRKIAFIAGLLVLVSGCASRSYEVTTPEKRYQAMVNSEPNRATKNRRWGEWTNTFSVLAPEGNWTFWRSTPFGHIAFTGSPEGIASRYVGYEVRMLMWSIDVEQRALELEALRTGDFDSYVDKSMKETQEKYARWQAEWTGGGRHPAIPYEYSMKIFRLKDMTCRLYEGRKHQYVWSKELRDKGPGSEQYNIGLSCPGFFNGVFSDFGYGITVRVNNMHKLHGVEIDHEAIVEDVKRRVQRSLDSVRFDGEFTQEVPEMYR